MARSDIDYKEYSRLRDIAHKRIGRLEKAGYNVDISLPTVKQVRASQNPYWFMAEMMRFVQADTTLSAMRKSGARALPVTAKPRFPKVQPVPVTTAEMRKQRRRERERLARQRRAVSGMTTERGKRSQYQGYFEAARAIANRWMEAGRISGDVNYLQNAKWILNMPPKQVKSFVEYMEYRYSQADFDSKYVLADFVEDYLALASSGRSLTNIQRDFDVFMADQAQLSRHRDETERLGVTSDELLGYFHKFAKG